MWCQVHVILDDNKPLLTMWQDRPLNKLNAFSVNTESGWTTNTRGEFLANKYSVKCSLCQIVMILGSWYIVQNLDKIVTIYQQWVKTIHINQRERVNKLTKLIPRIMLRLHLQQLETKLATHNWIRGKIVFFLNT